MLARFYKPVWLFVAIVAALVAFVGLASHSDGAVLASPALTITEYPLNPGTVYAGFMIRGPDNNVWFSEFLGAGRDAIARITPSGTITDFPVPGSSVRITAGSDGNIWYTRTGDGAIGKMTLTGAVVTYTLPAGITSTNGITSGPDGNLWITDKSGNQILRVTTDGQVTGQFPVPTPASGLTDIVTGADGNLWFIEWAANQIGRITPSGIISEFPIPTADAHIGLDITAGPDGAIWFGERRSYPDPGQVGRIASSGTVTEYPMRNGFTTAITAGSDGNLWAINSVPVAPKMTGDVIIRITPYGFIQGVSDVFYKCICAFITSGGNGKIWFTKTSSIATFDPRSVPPPSVFYFPLVSQ